MSGDGFIFHTRFKIRDRDNGLPMYYIEIPECMNQMVEGFGLVNIIIRVDVSASTKEEGEEMRKISEGIDMDYANDPNYQMRNKE